MTHPPAGPSTPPSPAGPGRDDTVESPLDPNSPKGIDVAQRLTRTLALIRLEIAERKQAAQIGDAA